MIDIVCVYKTNPEGIYTAEWVNKLHSSIKKHCNLPYKFSCLTDSDEVIPGKIALQKDLRGWWSKLELFTKGLFTGPTLYLDLDTVISGSIDTIINKLISENKFTMIRGKSKRSSSCIMYWNGDYSYIYKKFSKNKHKIMSTYITREQYGDQAFISEQTKHVYLQDVVGSSEVDYESNIRRLGNRNAKIILFAKPNNKPHTSFNHMVVKNWTMIGEDFNNDVEDRHGWTWPKHDKFCWKVMRKHPNLPSKMSRYVTKTGAVLQAGGNCGYYAEAYSKIFNKVITLEPDLLNFYCLLENTKKCKNVVPFRAALGDKYDMIQMTSPKTNNVGMHYIDGAGDIPQITIDSLNIKHLDLIHLDIEGYELFALKGAEETIRRCKPTVALEYNKLADKYGYTMYDLNKWFTDRNYVNHSRHESDFVFIPK